MTDVIQFAVLGLGSGGIYALLACGLVLVYRGSGVINFAQGGFALLGAYIYLELHERQGLPSALALGLTVVAVAGAGLLVQVLIISRLRHASPLARVIATLGVLTVVQQAVLLVFGETQQSVTTPVPTTAVHLGHVVFGQQALWLGGVAVAIAAVLQLLSQRTRVGLAISAAAENPRAARSLGWSVDALAVLTWGAGGAVAGLAGALFPSTSGGYITIVSMSALVVAALAAALLAGFTSYPVAVGAGLFIGTIQSEATRYFTTTGVAEAVPFLAIVLVLVLRGRSLPVRGTVTDRLPRVGPGPSVLTIAAVSVVAAVLVGGVVKVSDLQAVTTSLCFAVLALSLVVVTGYAGQLSMAQMALGGVGAYVAGRLVSAHGWTLGPALLLGIACTAAAGALLGLPSLRTRGVNLAVVTLGLGFALHEVLFSSTALTGGNLQTPIAPQRLFGIQVDPILHSRNYALLCLLCLAFSTTIVTTLRHSRAGRRLLAVRTNERAAASLGINVFLAKLYAFSLAAAIAGLGGILLAFSYSTILYADLFSPFGSIEVVSLAVIGGIGWVSGPAWSMPLVTGGIGTLIASQLSAAGEKWVPLAGGVILIAVLMWGQNGLAASLSRLTTRKPRPLTQTSTAGGSGQARERVVVPPLTLRVQDVTRSFGGLTALAAVSLEVRPGQVLGVLGPNGAGKTTLVDVITGFTRPDTGSVSLANRDLIHVSAGGRSRYGLCRTFQSLELFDDLTVRENLLVAEDPGDLRSYLTGLVRRGSSSFGPAGRAAVADLELEPLLDLPADALSFGQRRLVALARAVATMPSVLLLDEPGAGLDKHETEELGRLVRTLAEDWGMGVLLIEHDVDMVAATAHRVVVLDFGRIIAEGDPNQVLADPLVRAAYLGKDNAPPSTPSRSSGASSTLVTDVP